MNYAYLAKKYIQNASFVMNDRTYDGLEWKGPGLKPTIEQFRSLQELEDIEARKAERAEEIKESAMEEIQRQARAKAEIDAIPFQDKINKASAEVYERCYKQITEAMDIRGRLEDKQRLNDCWREITMAQEAINREAQQYLDDTAHYLSWNPEMVPAEVLEKRKIAHERLKEGAVVFANWATLRANELPSRETIEEAIRLGGETLANIKKICKEVALKYPSPKRTHI